MARRLTDQQRRRIALQQARRRSAANSGGHMHAPDESSLGDAQETLVIAHYGSQLDVETLTTPPRTVRCFLRTNLAPLATGDRVIAKLPAADSEQATGIVVAGCERRTLLARPDSRGVLRPVAANVDTLLITFAPVPEPFPFLIDRYLVAAAINQLEPVLLCNKMDLLQQNHSNMERLLLIYRHLGLRVFCVSTQQDASLTELRQFLHNRTSVFVGQSGVGKSSLIRALLPGIDIAIGELSTGEEKGKHTTTTARLYHLPQGGDLIDSPGIRELTLSPLPAAELLACFNDLYQHAQHCRFRDCSHQQEPGCALLAAEAAGDVFPERLASYRHLLASFTS